MHHTQSMDSATLNIEAMALSYQGDLSGIPVTTTYWFTPLNPFTEVVEGVERVTAVTAYIIIIIIFVVLTRHFPNPRVRTGSTA